jgi:predicted P-loop ATPase
MSAAAAQKVFGAEPTNADLAALLARWITPELASQAMIQRVDSWTGRSMFGRKSGDCSGLIIPYVDAITGNVNEYQLRLDHPDMEAGKDGQLKPTRKYLWPPGRRSRAYLMPGTNPDLLRDVTVPIVFTEGVFKTIALHRLSLHQSDRQRFLPIGLIGVDNFRTTIGKAAGVDGNRADIKGFLPELEQIAFKDRLVFVAYDSDVILKPQVQRARRSLTFSLQERGGKVGYLEWKPDQAKGIDDLLAAVGPNEVLKLLEAVNFANQRWREELIVNDKGKAGALLANALTPLRNAPEWQGVLAYSEFDAGIYVRRDPPFGAVTGEWEDQHDRLTVEWLQRNGVPVGLEVTGQAVQTVARERSFHPVKDYLSDLKWDGTPRLDTWLIDLAGVAPDPEDTPADQQKFISYCKAVSRRWMISTVARVFKPGCQADHILILEGPQGIGKSSAAKILGGKWYCDELPEIGSKDASLQVRGTWILELSELDVLSRAEAGRIKSFISRQTDKYRPPYARRTAEFPRQCVFIGTTNSTSYLKDETGGRRFWPIRCKKINLNELAKVRDQLFAEAVVAFRAGESWWLESGEVVQQAQREQEERYEEDPWHSCIIAWATDRLNAGSDSVSVVEVLEKCLNKPGSSLSRADEMRVGRCLTRAKWERYRDRKRSMEWRYRKPKDQK